MVFDNEPMDTNLLQPFLATVRVNAGSGVICQLPGHAPVIITAHHVVGADKEVTIRASGLSGYIVGSMVSCDEQKDIAVISLQTDQRLSSIACLSDAETVRVGDDLYVLGYPDGWNGERPLIAQAILAGIGTETWISSNCSWGNSGGPVLKETGEGYKLAGIVVGNVGAVHADLNKIRRTLKIVEADSQRSAVAKTIATIGRLISEMIEAHFRTGFIKIASIDDILSLLL